MEDRPVSEEDNCEEEIQFGVVEELPTIGSSNPDYALELEPFPEVRVIRLSSIAEEEARDGDDDIAPITSNPVEAWETIKERLSHERTLTIPTTDSGDLAASPSLQNLTSVFSTKRRSIDSHKRKNEFKMLTSSQLADLFRRLDSDNNGELDLAEFLAMVKKLNLLKYLGLKEDHEAEDYMKSIFREVDVNETGVLDIEEFISAYFMIYNRTSQTEALHLQKRFRKTTQVITEIVTATRYGKKENNEFIFEVYNGRVSGDFSTFEIYEKRIYEVMRAEGCPLDNYLIDTNFSPISLDALNVMIVSDAKANKEQNSSIYWWLDVAMEAVSPLNVNKYIAGLGLPNESKFLGNFNSFGIIQSSGEKSQMFVGNGVSALGSVSSVSFFVQSMWLKNVPLVRALPEWLDSIGLYLLGAARQASLKRYYETRFAFFFSVSWPANKLAQYSRTNDDALAFATRLCCEDDTLFPESSIISNYADLKAGGQKKWDKFRFTTVIDPQRNENGSYRTYDESRWLLGKSHMDSRPTRVVFNNIALSLIDQSYGPSACITIRKIDNEGKVSLDLGVQAQLGIMGRIITAIRIKLLESVVGGGLTHNYVIHEHPAEIAGHIMNLVHNFSMNTLGTLSSWETLLSREVNELTVSKHFAHSEAMREVYDVINEYANRKYALFNRLQKELVVAEANIAAHRVEAGIADIPVLNIAQAGGVEHSALPEVRLRSSTLYKNYSKPVASSNIIESNATLRSEVVVAQTVPAGAIEDFLGHDFRKRIGFLGHMLDGDTQLEIKGMVYFRERLERFQIKLTKLDERMKIKDDQKRNFFSFLLTVSTVFLAPLAALTGYWGMNFDNMQELDHTKYPLFPGIEIMWVSGGVIYMILLLLSIHFRILYSAM